MFLLIWPAVLFAVRINANKSTMGTSSTKENAQTATMTCTVPDLQKLWSCTIGQVETHQSSTVIMSLSAERNSTNVTCRVNLTGTIPKQNLTSEAELQNCTRNETQPTSNCRAPHPNTTTDVSWAEEPMMKLSETVQNPEVISAFLIGFLLATLVSTVVCCLMRKSHRKKLKIYGNLSDALEMTNDPAAAGPGASAAGNSDVDYSTIKFSAVRPKKLEETTETEYAEIKREETVQEEEEDGEGSQEEGAIMVVEEVQVEAESGGMMEGEDVALCSDVEVVVSEMEACSV